MGIRVTLTGGRCLVGEPSVAGAGVKIADRVHTCHPACPAQLLLPGSVTLSMDLGFLAF